MTVAQNDTALRARIAARIARAIHEVDEAVAACRHLSMAVEPVRTCMLSCLSNTSIDLALLLGEIMEE